MAELRAKLELKTPGELLDEIVRLRTGLTRIASLDEKNVPKYAQEIARQLLSDAE